MGRRGMRRAGRTAGRRAARRTTRRVMRRRMRRRILIGGAVLLAGAAGYGAYKLSQKDVDKIEEHTGQSAEELSEEDLVAAMEELGIQSIELDENDQAIIRDAQAEGTTAAGAGSGSEPDYLDELERLAKLRDQGVLTDEEFSAKKKQLLGL